MPHPRPDPIASAGDGVGRGRIVSLARSWIGTPYHHQASVKSVGTDCIGLVRGVWRALYGAEAEALPAYSRDWAEATGEETLLAAARRHLIEVAPADAQPGDVLVFRYRASTVAKHAAILATPTTMIHAFEGAPVSEVALSAWWRRRLAATFSFPA
jgi:NlpC/P60 family putative phage cell wall peptidase